MKKNTKKFKLSFYRTLLHPSHGDFCTATEEVKLEPKPEELMLRNWEIDSINIFLSSSDTKAGNTAFASLKHNRFSWFGPTTLTHEWFPSHQWKPHLIWTQDFNLTIHLYSVCKGNLESIKCIKQKRTNTEEDPTAQSCLADTPSRSMWPNYNSNKKKHKYFILKHFLKKITKKRKQTKTKHTYSC